MKQETVSDDARIDYAAIVEKYPWIVERDQDCIVSPDSDGLLCGLFMSHYLGWRVRGFYDGKVLAVEKGVDARTCVFLDMEIARPHIRSVGQHMVLFNKKDMRPEWENFAACISANELRGFDFNHDFKQKYPLGTVHLLMAIVGSTREIAVPKSAVCPLLYTDGTFKNQFNYPENCLSWLEFLRADEPSNPLGRIFLDPHYSTYELMVELRTLFSEIHRIGGGKRGGDKVKISDSSGKVVNMDASGATLVAEEYAKAETFLRMLATLTGWDYDPAHWVWGPYDVTLFQKGSTLPTKGRYNELLAQNPISLAIISRQSIEYTLDGTSVL